MMKTILYARSSIKSQEHSIEMQKALALEKVKLKGIIFDDLFFDEAVSARKTKIHERPELSRLVQEINKGMIKTIYVYKRDRLARSVVQSMELYELFRSKQVTVVFTADNEIPIQYSAAGEFFELIIAGFNEREANQIVQRIKETKYTMTKQGKHAQGRIAFGYYVDKNKVYHVEPEQAKIIRKLFDAIIETKCNSFSDFVRSIQQHDWFPDKWDYSRIQTLLSNTYYKGIRRVEEFGEYIEIENDNLTIVNEDTWDKAQEQMSRLIQTRIRNSNRIPMALDGLLLCGKCGNPMFGKQITVGSTKTFYTCKKHNYLRISPSLLETALLEESARFITQLFQTYFPEVYTITHGDLIKFYKQSLTESKEAIEIYKQELYEYTSLWLQEPSLELKNSLLHLHNRIEIEELIQEHYPIKLAELQHQYELMKRLQHSVDLVTEVLSYDTKEQESFIRDVIHSVNLHAPSLSIQFRDPFQGKAVVVHVAIS